MIQIMIICIIIHSAVALSMGNHLISFFIFLKESEKVLRLADFSCVLKLPNLKNKQMCFFAAIKVKKNVSLMVSIST